MINSDLENLLQMKEVTLHKFKRGEKILRQGEKIEWIFYLEKGTCYRSVITEQGEEFCYWIRNTDNRINALLGVFSLYGYGYSGSTITAKTNCLCYRIPGKLFLKYADQRPKILRELLERCLRQYGDLDQIFHSYREKSAPQQVANVLLEEFKDKTERKDCTFDYLSQKTALHRVTVAKIMSYLKETGIVYRRGNVLQIKDREELERIAAGKKIKYYNNKR